MLYALWEQVVSLTVAWFFWHSGNSALQGIAVFMLWSAGYLACCELIKWERKREQEPKT